MMGFQGTPARLFYDFWLDEHVPFDHMLRASTVEIPAPETTRRREGANPHGVSGCRPRRVGQAHHHPDQIALASVLFPLSRDFCSMREGIDSVTSESRASRVVASETSSPAAALVRPLLAATGAASGEDRACAYSVLGVPQSLMG
jgi:hypothetical protein